MIKKIIYTTLGVLACGALSGCDDVFTPAEENLSDISQMQTNPQFAHGFLLHIYRNVPGYYDNSEYATDDAVTNEKNNAIGYGSVDEFQQSVVGMGPPTQQYSEPQHVSGKRKDGDVG